MAAAGWTASSVPALGLDAGTARIRVGPGAAPWTHEVGLGSFLWTASSASSDLALVCLASPKAEQGAWATLDALVTADAAATQPQGRGNTSSHAEPPCGPIAAPLRSCTVLHVARIGDSSLSSSSAIASWDERLLARRIVSQLAQPTIGVASGCRISFPSELALPALRVVKTEPPSSYSEPVHIERHTQIVFEALGTAVGLGAPLAFADTNSALGDLLDIVKLPLLYPDAFAHLNVTCPKGVLLFGPPGTGKTLTVRTAAECCGAQLVSVRGPELFASYLGDSERNVRRVFRQAEAVAAEGACILFIDEIDALTPRRDSTEAHEARVVAQLLTLMDGIKPRTRLVIVGATNRPNSIDPAMRRPGRFDREIQFAVPTEDSRLKILRAHCAPLPLSPDVDLAAIAKRAIGQVKQVYASGLRLTDLFLCVAGLLQQTLPSLRARQQKLHFVGSWSCARLLALIVHQRVAKHHK
eukprot:m.84735 g.84735  ORF g.84735 m.84735 type:complete len:470 (-) comp8357_c0_seq1:998-2407(-)